MNQNSLYPHRRFNPLLNEWILVAPHRADRPWKGKIEKISEEEKPAYDKSCYLCPGNKRVGNAFNLQYSGTFVFINDHSALLLEKERMTSDSYSNNKLFKREQEKGICEVICYSPIHNKTMANMSVEEIEKIVKLWQDRFTQIGSRQEINHVQIFETRGSEMGSSNSHPHGQIWAQEHIPSILAIENKQQKKYFDETGKSMLPEYLNKELQINERIVCENTDFVALVPYWAEWPYETIILPTFQISAIDELKETQITNLAKSLALTTNMYAQFFDRPKYGATYVMGIHQKPTDKMPHPELQMHIHFETPYLTSTRLKFQGGYEKFAEKQRDITPELAAQALKKNAESIFPTEEAGANSKKR